MFEKITNLLRKPQQQEAYKFPEGVYPEDYPYLDQFLSQNLFVYDDLKQGGKHHSFIDDYRMCNGPVHPACYTSEKYNFFLKDLGDGHSYPYALPESFTTDAWLIGREDPARIKGELWAVHPRAFVSLDIHKDRGVQFIRERVRITYPTTPIAWSERRPLPAILPDTVKTIEAWMYIGIPDYWRDQVGGIFQNQMPTYTHSPPKKYLKEFYKFEAKRSNR